MYKLPIAAISPNFSLELRDIRDFVAEFGPYNGQYVARYPTNWMSEFEKHIEELSPVDNLAAKTLLDKIKRTLFEKKLRYDLSKSWSENASDIDVMGQCKPVVGDGCDPRPHMEWVEALVKIRESRNRTWKFRGTWDEYMSPIEPLLLSSPAAFIVDQYFDPCDSDSLNMIIMLLNRIKGSRCYEIHVITVLENLYYKPYKIEKTINSADPQVTFIVACKAIDDLYKPVMSKYIDRKLIFHFVKQAKHGTENLRLHNRFFLTRYGAIDFGQGVKLSSQPKAQMDASIVDKAHHDNLCLTYIYGVTKYKDKIHRDKDIAYPLNVDSYTV
ncbi:hypothetical protein LBMAG10_12300 [Actinomycetes bacterium]|nr:hypothetical protein LBMAG10_12300 [Actinomycetes bacterium]